MKAQTHSVTPFQKLVYDFVRTIPKGSTVTYKQVAAKIGHPKAYRAVGNALNKNPFSFAKLKTSAAIVPCHRVLKSDGSIGGFASGSVKKLQLLRKEGVIK